MFNVKVSFKTTEWQNIVALDVWALAYFPPPCINIYKHSKKMFCLRESKPGFLLLSHITNHYTKLHLLLQVNY